MTIAVRAAALAGGLLAAALVLFAFHIVTESGSFDVFGGAWGSSSLLSSLSCDCALNPSTGCMDTDWEQRVATRSAAGVALPNTTVAAFSRDHVCAARPAVVVACVRPDLSKRAAGPALTTLSPRIRSRINTLFMDKLEDTLADCDGDVVEGVAGDLDSWRHERDFDDARTYHGAEEEDDEAIDPGPGGGRYPPPPPPPPGGPPHHHPHHKSPKGLFDRIHDHIRQHHERHHAHQRHRHTRRRLKWQAAHGHLRALSKLAKHMFRDDDDAEAQAEAEAEAAAHRELNLQSVSKFINDFRDWEDGNEPIEMEITGSGWRKCMRRLVWSLSRHYVCELGLDLVHWHHGLRAAHLYTHGVEPEFAFGDDPEAPGAGEFVLQALGTTRWRMAPDADEPMKVELIAKAGDIVYIPKMWWNTAECLTPRCVSMLV